MKNLVLLLMTLLGAQAFAQTTANTQTYFEYLSSPVNLVKNPHARLNTLNTTAGGSVTSGRSAGSSELNGLASHTCTTTAVNSYCGLATNAPKAPYDNANQLCEAAIWFSGSGGNLMSFVVTPSGGSAITLPLRSSTDFATAYIPLPCNAIQPTLRLTQTTAGTPGAIKYGMYYGPSNRLGSAKPENTFTAKVSAAGVVTLETGDDWINGNCVYASSAYTCTFTSNFFTSVPNCFVQSASTAKWGGTSTGTTTASSFLFAVWNNGGTGTNEPTTISCTRTGSDYVQPAISPKDFSFNWKAYTPSITSSSGTLANYSLTGTEYRRDANGKLWIKGTLTFTGSPGTWNSPRVGIPSGLTILKTMTNIQGVRFSDTGSSVYGGSATVPEGLQYVVLQSYGGTSGAGISVSQASPFTWANTDIIEWTLGPIDIAEWGNSQSALQLEGSVTSNEPSAGRLDSSSVTCSGSSSVSGGVLLSSIGNISSGNCTLTFASAYSTAPRCWANFNTSSASVIQVNVGSATTTGATLSCRSQNSSTTSNCTSVTADIFCLGPR